MNAMKHDKLEGIIIVIHVTKLLNLEKIAIHVMKDIILI